MSEKKRTIIAPSYLEQFKCIGSACEDTCCAGWSVTIDQPTYKKYNKVKDIKFKAVLDKHVKRNRSNPTEENYAKIVLESNACPLLNEDKLCSIQLKLGEDYLSKTCSTYPRISNKVDHQIEKSGTVSCPEIARLVLLNPNGIEFNEIEESTEIPSLIYKKVDTITKRKDKKVEEHFWKLRIFVIQVLQNRAYTLSDRLIIIGMFCKKVEEKISTSREEEIPKLVDLYTDIVSAGTIRESLNDIPSQIGIQIQLIKELAQMRFEIGIASSRYIQCFSEFMSGIYSEASVDVMTEKYHETFNQYFSPFISKHEYILENFLVNYVYKNIFPVGGRSVSEEYTLLVMQYAMIKLHLIGMAGYHKEAFGIDHAIMLIQSFSKAIEHTALYLSRAIQFLEKNGFNSMAYMAILIKN